MKTYRAIALFCCIAGASDQALSQSVTPNSRFFSVTNYYYPDNNGDYRPYRVAGFAEQLTPPAQSRLMILPQLTIRQSDVKFFASNGSELLPGGITDSNVGSIDVRVRYASAVPQPQQIPAIAGALNGVAIPNFRLAPPRDNFGNPLMTPQAQAYAPAANAIRAATDGYSFGLFLQNQLINQYGAYQSQPIPMSELRIGLMVEDEEIASQTFTGAVLVTGSALPAVTARNPTPTQVNKLREGNFYVVISYRFLDSQASTINATINRHRVMEHFLNETQQAVTKRRSSGFQIFHIGSRRSKITQSINIAVDSSSTLLAIQNTRIVMRDASEAMVRRFEAAFLPSLSKEDAIQNHLSAAAAAEAAGNPELATVHRDYAASLRDDNEMAEVDAIGAAAALNAGDYAGFVARGVRMSDSNNVRANNFRRVIHDRQQMDQVVTWDDTEIVSVQREVSVPIQIEQPVRQTVLFGICDVIAGDMPVQVGWNQPLQGIMPTCVTQPGAFFAANLLPGTIVTHIGSRRVTTRDDLRLATERYEAGDEVQVRVWSFQHNGPVAVTVRPTRGAPVPEEEEGSN